MQVSRVLGVVKQSADSEWQFDCTQHHDSVAQPDQYGVQRNINAHSTYRWKKVNFKANSNFKG